MTRPRKLTLSMREFSHLVSESLDIANSSTASQSLIHQSTVVSENSEKPKSSTFQRIFARPSPSSPQLEESTEKPSEGVPDTPRKMGIAWPFSRSSPRKHRSVSGEASGSDVSNATGCIPSPEHTGALTVYKSLSSSSAVPLAAASTSSLGSLVPADERMFSGVSRDGLFSAEDDAEALSFRVAASSPITIIHPRGSPTRSGHYSAGPRSPLHLFFGNRSAASIVPSSNGGMVEPVMDISPESSLAGCTRESTDTSMTLTETEFSDDDPTPRATTFGALAMDPPSSGSLAQRRRSQALALIMPSRTCRTLSIRPAVGVSPHVPSEMYGSLTSTSSCLSSPTSSRPHSSSLTSMSTRSSSSVALRPRKRSSSPPKSPTTSATPSDTRTSKSASVSSLNSFPWGRARAGSRSMKSPPLPGPPPTGPLPAVPTPSSVPPVPPLPPLLKQKSFKIPSQLPISSPTRAAFSGTPSTSMAVATPPSPPGSLRLPSRLSWVGAGRAVVAPSSTLPSPPASPTKSPKGSKLSPPGSPSKTQTKRSGNLKRPTSIGVLEAADNAHVRRTKSILLLGSRSKSGASLCVPSSSPPKRVQIHVDANGDADSPPRKPRRKSSAAPANYSVNPGVEPAPSGPQLLVPRERRHSAPLLSRMASVDGASAEVCDWTLSLPFSTDVPGHKITPALPSPSSQRVELEAEPVPQDNDWTLCMPLKVRLDQKGAPTDESEECVSECTLAQTSETCMTQTQLPTPSPSPTPSTPLSLAGVLDEQRPSSPASLGPHAGGLNLDGGCGKRGSGWDVFGWFGPVSVPEDEHSPTEILLDNAYAESGSVWAGEDLAAPRRSDEVRISRRSHEAWGRNPSQDSSTTISTAETIFYSARSSLLVACDL
ncbi:hypothetical protein HYDPIDRAFT_32189 [Hydnomerulius pinastri MD-312]|uniref:Uncharacterized protein n=1 Tax=Hydnomerulius pinastri MD-312 TaxID=994086 RepID=A0A0C9WAK6_9AGAM|nr:hypothetical protein HYDPIDRAFT_32189 [Hydnomerulius pinastri MD-312]